MPMWINAEWNDLLSTFVYLNTTKLNFYDSTEKYNMTVFDLEYMEDETTSNKTNLTRAIVIGRYEKLGLFSLKTGNTESKAITVCRAFPNVTLGVQTLNTLVDPVKEKERERRNEITKKKYFDNFGGLNISQSYNSLLELLWYTRLPCFDVRGVTSEKEDEKSVIKRCFWRGKMVDCSQIFVTKPTDRGMCCSFNFINAEELFKKSLFSEGVTKLQDNDKNLSFGGAMNRYKLCFNCIHF